MNKKELTRLISAMLLGDGGLCKPKLGKNAYYAFTQITKHQDYIDWQVSVLSELTSVNFTLYKENTDEQGVHRQEKVRIYTKIHPFYTDLYNRTYFDGRKSVSTHDLELLDWQCAAIWYMDDGYRLASNKGYSTDGNVFLCTDNFTHAEVMLLQKVLYSKLSIPFNIRRRGYKKDGTIIYRLVVTRDNADRFIDGIRPYIFPSFEYKLDSERKLLDTECVSGNDIV